MKDDVKKIGLVLYIIAFAGALLTTILESMNVMPELSWLPWAMVIVGILIGLININESEAVPFMVGALVLGAAVGILALIPAVGGYFEMFLFKIAGLSIPIAIPVAFKTIFKKALP